MIKMIGYLPLCLALAISAAYFLLRDEPTGKAISPKPANRTIVTRGSAAQATRIADATRNGPGPDQVGEHLPRIASIDPTLLRWSQRQEGVEWELPAFEGTVDAA